MSNDVSVMHAAMGGRGHHALESKTIIERSFLDKSSFRVASEL